MCGTGGFSKPTNKSQVPLIDSPCLLQRGKPSAWIWERERERTGERREGWASERPQRHNGPRRAAPKGGGTECRYLAKVKLLLLLPLSLSLSGATLARSTCAPAKSLSTGVVKWTCLLFNGLSKTLILFFVFHRVLPGPSPFSLWRLRACFSRAPTEEVIFGFLTLEKALYN